MSTAQAAEESCGGHITGAEAEFKAVNQAKPVCEKTLKSLKSLRETSEKVNANLKVGGQDIGKFTGDSFTMESTFSSTKEKLRQSIQSMEGSKGMIVKGLELGKETGHDASEGAKNVGLGHQYLEKEMFSLRDARRKLEVLYQSKANEINQLRNSGGDPMGINIQANVLEQELAKQKARVDEIDQRMKVIQSAVKAHQSAHRDHLRNLESTKKINEKFTQQKKQLESAISSSQAQLVKLENVKLGAVEEEGKSGISGEKSAKEVASHERDSPNLSDGEKDSGKASSLSDDDKKAIKADKDGEMILAAHKKGESLDPSKTAFTDKDNFGEATRKDAVMSTIAAQETAEKNAESAEQVAANTKAKVEELHKLDKKIFDGNSFDPGSADKAALLAERQSVYEQALKEPGVGAELTRLGIKPVKDTDAGPALESIVYSETGAVAMPASRSVFSGEAPTEAALKAVQDPTYAEDVSRGFEETRNTLAKDIIKTDTVVTEYQETKARIANNTGESISIGAGEFGLTEAPVDNSIQRKILEDQNAGSVVKQDAYSSARAAGADENYKSEFMGGLESKTRDEKVANAVELATSPLPLVGSGLEVNRTAGESNRAEAAAARDGYTPTTSESAVNKREAYQDAVTNLQLDAATSIPGGAIVGKAAKAGDAAVTSTRVAENFAPDLSRASRAPAQFAEAATETVVRQNPVRQIDETVAAGSDSFKAVDRSGEDLTREIQESSRSTRTATAPTPANENIPIANDNFKGVNRSGEDVTRDFQEANRASNDNLPEGEYGFRPAERAETIDGPRLTNRQDQESIGGGRLGQGARLGESAPKPEPQQQLSVLSRGEDWRTPPAEAPSASPARATAETSRAPEPVAAKPVLESYEKEKIVREAQRKLSNADEKSLLADVVAASPTNKAEVRDAFNASARRQGIPEDDIRRMRMGGGVERMEEAANQYRLLEQQTIAEKVSRENRAQEIAKINARSAAAAAPERAYVPDGPSAKWTRPNDPNPFETVEQRRKSEAFLGPEKTEKLIREAGLKNFQQESRQVVSGDRYGVESTIKNSLGLRDGTQDLRQQSTGFRTKLAEYEKSVAREVRLEEISRAQSGRSVSTPSVASSPSPTSRSYTTAEIDSRVPVAQRQALRDKAGVPEYLTSVAHEERNAVRGVVYQKVEDDYANELGSKARTNWDDAELTKRQQQAMREIEPKVEDFQRSLRQEELKIADNQAVRRAEADEMAASPAERPSTNGPSELPKAANDIEIVAKKLDEQGVSYLPIDDDTLVVFPDNSTTLGKAAQKLRDKYNGELFVDARLAEKEVAAAGGEGVIRVNPTLITDPSRTPRLEATINHEFRHVKNSSLLKKEAAKNTDNFNWEQTTFGTTKKPTGVRGYDFMGIDEVTASRQAGVTAKFEASAARKAGDLPKAEAKSVVSEFSNEKAEGFAEAALGFTKQAQDKLARLEGKAITSSTRQVNPVLSVRDIKAVDGTPDSLQVITKTFSPGRSRTDVVLNVKNPAGDIVPMRMPVPTSLAKLGDEEVVKLVKDYVKETSRKLEVHQNLLSQRKTSPTTASASRTNISGGSRAPASVKAERPDTFEQLQPKKITATKKAPTAQRNFQKEFVSGKFDDPKLPSGKRAVTFQDSTFNRPIQGRIIGTAENGSPRVRLADGSERILNKTEMESTRRANVEDARRLIKLEKYDQQFKTVDLEKIAPSLENSEYLAWGRFRQWSYADTDLGQGIKLHVGLAPEAIPLHGAALTEKLRELKVPHKVDANFQKYLRNSLNGDAQAGKFITIYADSDEQAVELARQMKNKFSELGIKTSETLNPPGEYEIAPGISARYGIFHDKYDGQLKGPDGSFVPDDRGTGFGPSWAKNPFEEEKLARAAEDPSISTADATPVLDPAPESATAPKRKIPPAVKVVAATAAVSSLDGSTRIPEPKEAETTDDPNRSPRAAEVEEEDDVALANIPDRPKTAPRAAGPETPAPTRDTTGGGDGSGGGTRPPPGRNVASPGPVVDPPGKPDPAVASPATPSVPSPVKSESGEWSATTGALVGLGAVGAVGATALILTNQKKSKATGEPGMIEGQAGGKLAPTGLVDKGKVGVEIPSVEVIAAEGMPAIAEGVEVSVACVEPVPCSLAGEMKAKSAEGKVIFKGLKFTEAHSSAILEFTAPGFEIFRAPAMAIDP